MQVISTNIGQPTTIHWNGKQEPTGIYKYPVTEPIFLRSSQVDKDTVSDPKHHGGTFKACYLFSSTHYPYWRERYPALDWDWGMFGENITIDHMDETALIIGATYRLGNALVQITIPREPCYKLGVRFKDQKIIKAFVDHGHPGTYVKVVQEGTVQTGDLFELAEQEYHNLTIYNYYKMLYAREKDQELLKIVQRLDAIPQRTKDKWKKYQKKGP